MTPCASEMNICDMKMKRAATRTRHIRAKRDEYERAQSKPRSRSAAPGDRVKPHRIARTAVRTLFAKGCVHADEDMPSIISMGGPPAAHTRKKPSVAAVMICGVGRPKVPERRGLGHAHNSANAAARCAESLLEGSAIRAEAGQEATSTVAEVAQNIEADVHRQPIAPHVDERAHVMVDPKREGAQPKFEVEVVQAEMGEVPTDEEDLDNNSTKPAENDWELLLGTECRAIGLGAIQGWSILG